MKQIFDGALKYSKRFFSDSGCGWSYFAQVLLGYILNFKVTLFRFWCSVAPGTFGVCTFSGFTFGDTFLTLIVGLLRTCCGFPYVIAIAHSHIPN